MSISMLKIVTILTIFAVCFTGTECRDYDDIFPEKTSFGYVPIGKKSKFFYWMAPSRNNPAKDPLVFWFQGGPGGSSLFGMFFEMGPFYIKTAGDDHATLRDIAWNNNANMVFIDHPIGVGFSVGEKEDLPHNSVDIGNQFLEFLEKFLELPEFTSFKGRELYITGESYAGHWIPYITNKLYLEDNPDINLKGVMMGNAWMTTHSTYRWYPEFANQHREYTKMTDESYQSTTRRAQLCERQVRSENKLFTYNKSYLCQYLYEEIKEAGGFNDYNIKRTTRYPDTYTEFLNRADVQQVLGVDKNWRSISGQIYSIFGNTDWWEDSAPFMIPMLLDPGVKTWWYNGDIDFICNWYGEHQAVNILHWEFQPAWDNTKMSPCHYGQCKELQDQNVRFIRLSEAGHMVPHDQPQLALDLINDLIGAKKIEEGQ